MGKRNNSIIISGLLVAFLVGTIVSSPSASAANPVTTLINEHVIPKLNQIITDIAALTTGVSATTETQIDNIETETNKIQMMKDDVGMIKGNQFVPFRAFTFLSGEICAQSGSVDNDFLLIDAQGSGTFFIIKSVQMSFLGLDAVDIVRTQSLLLSGGGFTYRSVDLSGTQSIGVNIEFLGAPLEFQPTTFPSEILGFISGSQDVKIRFQCDNSNGGNDITLNSVTVFGWAPPGTTFNLQYQE